MIASAKHLSLAELEARLDFIRSAPKEQGRIELIVRRGKPGERELLEEAMLDLEQGLVGDTWRVRGSGSTADGSAHPELQLTLANARSMATLAPQREHWPMAGDQFYVDFDLSAANLPPGSQLALGAAIIEVTPYPHNGCSKFAARFGKDALRFVNSPVGKELHLRGVNARVVQGGMVKVGDLIRKE